MWSLALERHLDTLRAALLNNQKLWPQITVRAKLGKLTVRGFAHRYTNYLNPGIATLQAIADAYEALVKEHTNAL